MNQFLTGSRAAFSNIFPFIEFEHFSLSHGFFCE